MDAKPPELVLPCDLPLWKTAQELLLSFQQCSNTNVMVATMLKLDQLCSISVDDHVQRGDLEPVITVFQDIIETQFSPVEREKLLTKTLPCMSRYAVSLLELKPKAGFSWSLQGQTLDLNLDRRFVASLLANVFFSTLPYRQGGHVLPLVPDMSFVGLFSNIRGNIDEALRLRNLLNYFDILDTEDPWGHIRIRRNVIKPRTVSLSGSSLVGESKPLTPIYVTQDRRCLDLQANSDSVMLRQLPSLNQQNQASYMHHPELLILYIFMENLLERETVNVAGLLNKTFSNMDRTDEKVLNATCLLNPVRATRNQHHLLVQLEQTVKGLKQGQQSLDDDCGDEKSSSISSKSSLLDMLADNLSMMVKSTNESGTAMSLLTSSNETDDIQWKMKNLDGKSGKKNCFADRLKEALQRGETPDSENCSRGRNSSAGQRFRVEHKEKPSLERAKQGGSDSYSFSDDSSYSFDLNMTEMDADLEDLMLHMTSPPEERDFSQFVHRERKRAVQNCALGLHTRSFSESFSDTVINLEQRAVGRNISWKSIRGDKAGAGLRRAFSFQLSEELLMREPVNKELEQPSGNGNKNPNHHQNNYAWVISNESSIDPLYFLSLWLGISLSDIPLLVFQSSECDLEEMFQLCGQIEQSGWTTKQVMDTILKYFKEAGQDGAQNSSQVYEYFRQALL